MEIDFSALASRVAAFGDVLGCIILSTDGLVLGAFPPGDGDGDGIKGAWVRFASVGEPERGFLKIDGSVWAYTQVGSYAAFAVAGGTTRPGVLLDHLEQTLLVAAESRQQLQMARPPGRVELVAGSRPKAVPETPGVPMPERSPEPEATAPAPAPAVGLAAFEALSHVPRDDGPAFETSETVEREHDADDQRHEGSDASPPQELGEDAEIDPVQLAREFAGLLQEDRRGDENIL